MVARTLLAIVLVLFASVATTSTATGLEVNAESRDLFDIKLCPGPDSTYVSRPNKALAPALVCCPTLTKLFSVQGCGFGCCNTCPKAYLFKNATCSAPATCKNGTVFFNIDGCGCGCRPKCPFANQTGVTYFHPCACPLNFACPYGRVPFSQAGCGCGCRPKVYAGF